MTKPTTENNEKMSVGLAKTRKQPKPMDIERRRKQEKKAALIRRCIPLYLMLLPGLVAMGILHYGPIYGVQIAFKDYRTSKGIWGSEWVWFKHFIRFFEYPYFGRLIWNTIWISFVGLCFFPIPIIFAIMLNEMRSVKLRKTCQMITYAPHFVSTVVVCSMIHLFAGTGGLFQNIVELLGGTYTNILSVPEWFPMVMAVSSEWRGLGWDTIIYMAALAGISADLIEAAKIDGANRFQVIKNVYLPHIKPTIVTLLILRIGSIMSLGFDKAWLLQNPLNIEGSSIIATYTYQVGMLDGQMSYSAAIGLFNNIINIILVTLANKASKKLAETSLW
jgi:putative aldouronate transport system permease protein